MGTIKLGCGVKKIRNEELGMSNGKAAWELKRDYLSPCYTTNIRDIPRVY